MNKVGLHIFIVLLITVSQLKSIAQPAFDTIKKSLVEEPRLFAKLDSRNSFIDNKRAHIFGIKAGLNYNNRISFGIGYNMLHPPSNKFDKLIAIKNSDSTVDSIKATLGLYYFSICTEYVYYINQKWVFSMPIQIGLGEAYYHYTRGGDKFTIDKNLTFIYEPSVSAEYKITEWLGLGTGIGFRFLVSGSKELNERFSSPTYAFKLLIYTKEIYRKVLKKDTK